MRKIQVLGLTVLRSSCGFQQPQKTSYFEIMLTCCLDKINDNAHELISLPLQEWRYSAQVSKFN